MSDPGNVPPVAPTGWRRWLVAGITLAALTVLVAFLARNHRYIAEHWALRPDAFVAIAILTVTTLALRGLANRILFSRLGISASAGDWFQLVTVSSFTNYLPLSAGMVAKAYFLKRVHLLPYGTFALGQLALLLVIISTNGAVGIATLGIAFPDQLVGIVGAGFVIMIAAGALMFPPEPLLHRIPERFQMAAKDGAPQLRRAWPAVALLQFGILMASSAGLAIAFDMGTSDVGFAACVIFTAASMLTRLFSITPGAIGIREFLIGGLAYLTGFELRDAVIASTATRTVEVAVVFALGGLFTRRLSGQVISSYDD
jgi:uncharacterized membrane protein YbhN (UPF0104 family)